jgi:Ca-activated chloride channel family protein
MTRGLAALLSSLVLTAGADTEIEAPSPLQYNTRGRTESGIVLQEQGEMDRATEAFAAALGLAPGDPLLQYNAGTAGLLSADPGAIELLQAATESAPAELQPSIFYNLGNAHMSGEDFPAAIDAFKASLRREPANADAKHNLELAMRRLQRQQQQQNEEQEQQQEQDQEQQQQQQQQQSPEQDQTEEPQQDPGSPLPDFEEQPDMTAEQAAAILEAVENLEREQRQKQALEQLKRARGDHDW